MTRELTNSMRSCWNSCHRKYKFTYVDLYKPVKTSDALSFGSAYHEMMEIYWKKMVGEKSNVELDVVNIAEDYAINNDNAYLGKTLLALFNGYANKYLDDDRSKYECIGVEMGYKAPLYNPETKGTSKTFLLAGKLDGIIVEKATGEVVIIEHKTTSDDIDPTSKYWMKLPIDGQVSGYYLGINSLGYTANKCLYDVIRKPTIKPSKAIPVIDENGLKIVIDAEGNRVMNKDGKKPRQTEDVSLGYVMMKREETADEWFDRLSADIAINPDKYFARMEIARSESDLQDYIFDMWGLSKELIEAENKNRFSRNPNACSVYGTCEFFDVCTGCASIEDTTLFTKKDKPNEEL